MTTVLVIKRVFRRAVQWVIDSIFALMNVLFAARITPVSVSGQSQLMSVSKRAPGRIAHLVIDSTELKVSVKVSGKSKIWQRTASYLVEAPSGS
ncbi:hypothetical protein [Escherichia coli]|uniref:hypothetical protein n=1 Tax=Escherichia coli TaxID=562 RepID=UPI00388D32AF